MIIYLLEYVVTELPSFWKEGCPHVAPTTSPYGYSSFRKEESWLIIFNYTHKFPFIILFTRNMRRTMRRAR